eukprot:10245154-Prorocentrum_lima.AAC.1
MAQSPRFPRCYGGTIQEDHGERTPPPKKYFKIAHTMKPQENPWTTAVGRPKAQGILAKHADKNGQCV